MKSAPLFYWRLSRLKAVGAGGRIIRPSWRERLRFTWQWTWREWTR